jgi:hypothetical protein
MAVRVIGLDKALRDIESKGKAAVQAVVETLAETADAIDFDAKSNAPNVIGGVTLNIKQRIDKIASNKGLNWKIGIQGTQDFDAYAEFGTGQDAAQILNSPGYTPEIRAIAMNFFKNGKGTLKGKPFLFPAWIKNTANLVDEIKDKIAEAVK